MNRMLPRSTAPAVPLKRDGVPYSAAAIKAPASRQTGWPISDRDVRALAPKGRAHAGR